MELDPKDRLAWQRLAMYRSLDEFRKLKPLLAPEVSRCFSPVIHEGRRQPYGAVVARYDDPADFGTLLSVADPEELRNAANGVNAIAYCVKGKPLQLLRLAKPLDSQDECCGLASWLDGVVARVDPEGTIWIASSQAVTTIDNMSGWTRPPIDDIVPTLSQLSPTAVPQTLDAIARLTYSYLSPRKVGTTLLYSLTAPQSPDHQTPGNSIGTLGLNVRNREDWPLIEHELKHCDGAAVLDTNGDLLRKGVILNATAASAEIQAERGTRHNSACRHSFDRPDLLAFVVSADGPVSIFSDGVPALRLALPDHDLPWNPSGGEMWTEITSCPNCRSKLTVRKIILYGYRESEEGHCPICGSVAASVHGWAVEVGLTKDADTIARIREFRDRNPSKP